MLAKVLTGVRYARRLPGGRRLQHAMREPWFRVWEWLRPTGTPSRLASGDVVRLHPRLLAISPQEYEAELTRALLDLLATCGSPSPVVIDIGAHVGLHTLLFSRHVGPRGHVIAVEPSPANARYLQDHVLWNRCTNVRVVEAAVSDRIGSLVFGFHDDPATGGFGNSIAYAPSGRTRDVPTVTIDALCEGLRPSLIKVDVEGAELLAIRGAHDTLTRTRPLLVIGVHPEPMQMLNTSPAELVTLLTRYDYDVRTIDGRPVGDPGFEEIVCRPRSGSPEGCL